MTEVEILVNSTCATYAPHGALFDRHSTNELHLAY